MKKRVFDVDPIFLSKKWFFNQSVCIENIEKQSSSCDGLNSLVHTA